MKACTLTITSGFDGKETTISRNGEMRLSPLKAEISYLEEDGKVGIILQGESAQIIREGGYTLRLYLEKGKSAKGYIGIGGQEGEIQTFTEKLAYSLSANSLLLSLQYTLVIGGENQQMKLRLLAREKKE